MFGVKIPRTAAEALNLDEENGNRKWFEAMAKEIAIMFKLKVFELHKPNAEFPNKEGWQFAPLHWVFVVKHDLRHKARLVIGGHVTDASFCDTYAKTIRMEHVRLQLYLALRNNDKILSGDIGSDYINSYTNEMIW